MDNQKSDTINKNNHDQNGFILPMVMIIMLIFALYTMKSIDHLNDERDFLHERQKAVTIDLQKKRCVFELVQMLSEGPPEIKSGDLLFSEGHLTYDITAPETGIEMVQAQLYLGNDRDSFIFYFDDNNQRIVKWVD